MEFISILLVAVAIFGHNYLLIKMFGDTPNLFFRVSPFHRAFLQMDSRLYAGLTFLAAFLASIVVMHLGWVGLGLAIAVLISAAWSVDEVRKAM